MFIEHLETDKHELEIQNQELRTPGSAPTTGSTSTSTGQDRVNALEQELAAVRDQLQQVQKELQNAQKTQGKAIGGPVLSKSRSLEVSFHDVLLRTPAPFDCSRDPVTCPNLPKTYRKSRGISRMPWNVKMIFVSSSNLLKRK